MGGCMTIILISHLTLIALISLISLSIKSPIYMILMIILITILSSLTTLFFSMSLWVAITLFLMMVGGLLILFMYMVSLLPNKKKSYPLFNILHSSLFFFFYMTLASGKMLMNLNNILAISYLPSYPPLMMFSVIYLFLLLFSISSMIPKNLGPLRS